MDINISEEQRFNLLKEDIITYRHCKWPWFSSWWKWYRKWRGGNWYLYHLDSKLPLIKLFCIWSVLPPKPFWDDVVLLDKEEWPDKRINYYKKEFNNI